MPETLLSQSESSSQWEGGHTAAAEHALGQGPIPLSISSTHMLTVKYIHKNTYINHLSKHIGGVGLVHLYLNSFFFFIETTLQLVFLKQECGLKINI